MKVLIITFIHTLVTPIDKLHVIRQFQLPAMLVYFLVPKERKKKQQQQQNQNIFTLKNFITCRNISLACTCSLKTSNPCQSHAN